VFGGLLQIARLDYNSSWTTIKIHNNPNYFFYGPDMIRDIK
jgi:hypothetical protein